MKKLEKVAFLLKKNEKLILSIQRFNAFCVTETKVFLFLQREMQEGA